MKSLTQQDAKEIKKLLIEEINTGLRSVFRNPEKDYDNVFTYDLPYDWMPIASFIKTKYREAGWTVKVSVGLTCESESKGRDCTLIFTTSVDKLRKR